MKLMIASDIHGSQYYCKKMIEAYRMEKADKLLLLGDILYHGPRNDLPKDYNPKAVISLLNEINNEILCVRGNCDSEVDQMVLNFPIMSDYCVLYINNHMIFATHGHIFHPDKLPMLKKGDILLNGHTHVPKCIVGDDYIYMNPGSISIPKEESAHGYMILEDNIFTWKDFNCTIYNKYKLLD